MKQSHQNNVLGPPSRSDVPSCKSHKVKRYSLTCSLNGAAEGFVIESNQKRPEVISKVYFMIFTEIFTQ